MGKKHAKKKKRTRIIRANPSRAKRKPKKAARRAKRQRRRRAPPKHSRKRKQTLRRKISRKVSRSKSAARRNSIEPIRARVKKPKTYQMISDTIRRRTKIITTGNPLATLGSIEKLFNRAKKAARKRSGPRELVGEYAYIHIEAHREDDDDELQSEPYTRTIVLASELGEKIGPFAEFKTHVEETISSWVSGKNDGSDFSGAKLILRGINFDRLEKGILGSSPKKRKKRAKSRRLRHRSK